MGGRNKKKKKVKTGAAKKRAQFIDGSAAVYEELRRLAGEHGLEFEAEGEEPPPRKKPKGKEGNIRRCRIIRD